MRSPSSTPVLLLGLFLFLPFTIMAVLNLTNTHVLGYSGIQLFASYGAIILSFFNGVILGHVFEKKAPKYSQRTMILNHVMILIAWGSLFIHVPALAIGMLLFSFVTTFWLDGRWSKILVNTYQEYSRIRFSLMTVICVLHILVLFPVCW